MSAVKGFRDFLDIHEAAAYLQDKGFASCTVQTVKFLAYETDRLPRPVVVGRRAYWSKLILDRFVESLVTHGEFNCQPKPAV